MTDKAFDRGIRNFFNPFARRLTLKNALLSVLVAAVLPLYGILKWGPAVSAQLGSQPSAGIGPRALEVAARYAATGVLLGLFSEVQSFIRVVLMTYYFARSAKQMRQLVLQS